MAERTNKTHRVDIIPKTIKDARHRQYLRGDKLGTGGFASVWRASMVDRRLPLEASECALKVVRRNISQEAICTRFKFELGIHNKLRHPNIVEFYRAFTRDDLTYISLELCLNGSLTDMMKKRKYLTMGEIRRFLIQLCGAVKYLHKRDIVHRDIKAGNVFLDKQMNVKLGDFGLAAILVPAGTDPYSSKYTRRTTFCGTPNYLAPEILSHRGHDRSVDIWALGILAYYLAVGRAPFHSKVREEIYERVRRSDYSWPELGPEQNEIPQDLKQLVGTLLVPETQRPTPDQIVRNPFLSQGYIPHRMEALTRTRRPRWARVPSTALPDSRGTYEELCRQSCVGLSSPSTTRVVRASGRKGRAIQREDEPVLLTLEREYSAGIDLEVPMPEGAVYLAWKPSPTKSVVGAPVVLEDAEAKVANVGDVKPGILTEGSNSNLNRIMPHSRLKRPKKAVPMVQIDE